MIKAINTLYNGNYYRSRLEARWAYFFDLLDIKYLYEPTGFKNDRGDCYLPDFYLPETYLRQDTKGLYIEIKHEYFHGFKHGDWFNKGLILFNGTPDKHLWGSFEKGGIQFFGSPNMSDDYMMVWICKNCKTSKIEHAEGNYNSCPVCGQDCDEKALFEAAKKTIMKRFDHQRNILSPISFNGEKPNEKALFEADKKMKRFEDQIFFLFPVFFNGKKYYKKDCDEFFLNAYFTRESLNDSGGVYLGDGASIYPDGSMDFS